MASLNPRRLTDPTVLAKISPHRLARFLSPFSHYLSDRGLEWQPLLDSEPEYVELGETLLKSDEGTPEELLIALFFVNEMATENRASDLESRCREAGYELEMEEEATAADVAIEVWLTHPEILEEAHATTIINRRRSFRSFRGVEDIPTSFPRDDDRLAAFETDMRSWFAGQNRGRWCRVTTHDDGPLTWILISHGDRFTREASIKGGKPGSTVFQPEKVDVLFHSSESNELWINAAAKEMDTYRFFIGKRVFGRADYFEAQDRYTLEPIRDNGRRALSYIDVPGIESVHLIELQTASGGTPWMTTTRRSDDLMTAMERRNISIASSPRLSSASFRLKFQGSRRPLTVQITPPNGGNYTRDQDAPIIETWLRARGFVIPRRDRAEETLPVMVGPGTDARPERVSS